jgi:hypothetical protein
VLGETVWQAHYTSTDVTVTGKLDLKTLEPKDVGIKLAHSLTFDKTFLDQTFNIPIPNHLQPLVDIEAQGRLQLLGKLTINGAGIEVNWASGHLVWVSAGTFIDVTASATGTLTGSVSVAVADGWLGTYTASANVSATLSVNAKAHFSGDVLGTPQLVNASLTGKLSGSYDYSFDGFESSDGQEVKKTNEPAGTFGPITLFVLDTP